MKRETLRLTGVGISMVVAGGATGVLAYFLLKKQLETKYELIAKEEIAKAKEFYRVLNKEGKLATPETAREVYTHEVKKLNYNEGPKMVQERIENFEEEPEPEPEEFDYEAELKFRDPNRPYIITWEEFAEARLDYVQTTLTYFAGDDVLMDERESPITDSDNVVGDANLLRWGYGSKNPNIVYIRNEKLQLDCEVVQNKGSYAKEVLGFVEHSEHRGRPRKFRRDDG